MCYSEVMSAKFWDRMAGFYSRKPVADEESYQRKLKVTQEYLKSDMDLLEFGCGTGSTALVHAPYVNHIRAIDCSGNMIKIARKKASEAGVENVSFEKSDIMDLMVPDDSLDVVLGLSILHLLDNKEEVISKVWRMLKKDGLFVSSTMCLGDKMAYIKYFAPVGKAIGLMPGINIFTRSNLEASLTDVGFTIDHNWQPSADKATFIVAKK